MDAADQSGQVADLCEQAQAVLDDGLVQDVARLAIPVTALAG